MPRAEERHSSPETNAKISAAKRGKRQSEEHKAARWAGRRPKFAVGDVVYWFDEIGVVEKLLGISGAHGNGLQARWYRVRFQYKTRDLVQEVLTKA